MRTGLTFLRPKGSRPHLLFYGPRPDYFFAAPGYQNYFFTARIIKTTALLVENISFISVLSKFQTFQLKED